MTPNIQGSLRSASSLSLEDCLWKNIVKYERYFYFSLYFSFDPIALIHSAQAARAYLIVQFGLTAVTWDAANKR